MTHKPRPKRRKPSALQTRAIANVPKTISPELQRQAIFEIMASPKTARDWAYPDRWAAS